MAVQTEIVRAKSDLTINMKWLYAALVGDRNGKRVLRGVLDETARAYSNTVLQFNRGFMF